MPWKDIPNTSGWQVWFEEPEDGKLRFKHANDRQSTFYLFLRLDALLGTDLGELAGSDPRVSRKLGGELEISGLPDIDLELLCTPVKNDILIVIRLIWEREKWEELEEQMLMEMCLYELYAHGRLSPATSEELKEYQQVLSKQYSHPRTASGNFDFETANTHTLFVHHVHGLDCTLGLSSKDVRRIQGFVGARITERYDLQTARAVKREQRILTAQERYDGPIDGIWNEKMQPFLDKLTVEEELLIEGRALIASLHEDFPWLGEPPDQRLWASHVEPIIDRHLKKLNRQFMKKYGRTPNPGEEGPIADQIRQLNSIQRMIENGLEQAKRKRLLAQWEKEDELDRYWSKFFLPGGEWSRMTREFQVDCIELWISAASFAYTAASVGTWLKKRAIFKALASSHDRLLAASKVPNVSSVRLGRLGELAFEAEMRSKGAIIIKTKHSGPQGFDRGLIFGRGRNARVVIAESKYWSRPLRYEKLTSLGSNYKRTFIRNKRVFMNRIKDILAGRKKLYPKMSSKALDKLRPTLKTALKKLKGGDFDIYIAAKSKNLVPKEVLEELGRAFPGKSIEVVEFFP